MTGSSEKWFYTVTVTRTAADGIGEEVLYDVPVEVAGDPENQDTYKTALFEAAIVVASSPGYEEGELVEAFRDLHQGNGDDGLISRLIRQVRKNRVAKLHRI